MTTNVTLWPQMLTVVANPDVDGRLTTPSVTGSGRRRTRPRPVRRRWPTPTLNRSRRSARWAPGWCEASDAELAALREAFAPVYAELATRRGDQGGPRPDPGAEGVDPGPTRLERPFGLRGEDPSDGDAASGTTPAYLNGVYRYTLTKQDAIAAGQGDDPEYPMTQTFWLENGHWTGSGDASGRYWVNGDRALHRVGRVRLDGVSPFRFTRDDDGNLTLEPAEPMDPAMPS